MVCFIRDIATWAHIAQCEATSWEVPLFSTEDVTGKITIIGEHSDYSMCWAILNGSIFYVESSTPDSGMTTLTVSRPMNAFDRSVVYDLHETYDITTDSVMDSEKQYYVKTSEVVKVRTKDPIPIPEKRYFIRGADPDPDYIRVVSHHFLSSVTYYEKTAEASYIKTSDIVMNAAKIYYIISGGAFIPTEDKSFISGTDYYEQTSDPTYEITSDSGSIDPSKIYYVKDYRDKYVQINNSIFESGIGYYENVNQDVYSATSDTSFQSGTTYYELTDSYGGTGTEVLESFIGHVIEDRFINEADPMYGIPYLEVYPYGGTVVDLGYQENEVYSFLDIIDLALEKKIRFSFVMSVTKLMLFIFPALNEEYNVFFGDGHNFMESATLSNELVARVTVRRIITYDDSEIELDEEKDFYWNRGGEITTDPPNPRIKGLWQIVSVEGDDVDLYDAAEEAMEDNDESVKVSFYSDQEFNIWDQITCKVNNELIKETVTSCTVSSDDSRYLYTIGKMPTTLTEKFEKQAANKETSLSQEQSITYEDMDRSYLETSGGTIGGNMAVNQTLSANTLVVGPGSYGSSLPSNGSDGQVFFVI